ncbi:MAG: hypothetical protein STSR0008_05700 [Ignavibacterium sp.]
MFFNILVLTMKIFIPLLITFIFSYNQNNFCQFKIQSVSNNFYYDNSYYSDHLNLTNDTTNEDSSELIGSPQFYSDSHLLFGTEIIDPFSPNDFLSRTTRLWKTDIRLGISQKFKNNITAFFSIRDNDSPQTNNIKIYEAGMNKYNDWGTFWFGQQRIQAGNNSYYLNDAFDRKYWDQGLVYDFLMRGIGSTFYLNKSEIKLFMGSDLSSSFIGGGNYSLKLSHNLSISASAIYVARDPQYSAFGGQFGIEIQESFQHFFGYQLFSYKKFDQDPEPIDELTYLVEGRILPDDLWNFGTAIFFRRLSISNFNNDEWRINFDLNYKLSKYLSPGLQCEYFEIYNFNEIHLGIFANVRYGKSFRIVPRFRYIITEFGPDYLFVGVEGHILFGKNK